MSALLKNKGTKHSVKSKHHFVQQIKCNIHHLNKSMQNISKLIQQSQHLLATANSFTNDEGEKTQVNPLLLGTNPTTNFKYRQKISNKTIDKRKRIYTQPKMNHNNSALSFQKSKQDQIVYHFSPQRTNKSSQTKRKTPFVFNPQSQPPKFAANTKHRRVVSMGSQSETVKTVNKAKQKIKEVIDSSIDSDNAFKIANFKPLFDDQSQRRIDDSYYLKKHISIKLFPKKTQKMQKEEQQSKLNQIIKQRSFIVEPPSLIKAKQAFSSNITKQRFKQKISEYKFVENYLSKNEIWAIYDKIVLQNIPELKWPIAIVDQVYKKIPNTSSLYS